MRHGNEAHPSLAGLRGRAVAGWDRLCGRAQRRLLFHVCQEAAGGVLVPFPVLIPRSYVYGAVEDLILGDIGTRRGEPVIGLLMKYLALRDFAVGTRDGKVGLGLSHTSTSIPKDIVGWILTPEQAKELCIQLALAAIELGVDPRGPDLPFQDQQLSSIAAMF